MANTLVPMAPDGTKPISTCACSMFGTTASREQQNGAQHAVLNFYNVEYATRRFVELNPPSLALQLPVTAGFRYKSTPYAIKY